MDSAHRERIHSLTTADRLLLADLLDSLDEEQWEGPTLCAGWGAQEMAAHLVQPVLAGRSVALADLRGEGVEALRVSLVSRSRRSAPPR